MRISDWSSDVCSSDLAGIARYLGLAPDFLDKDGSWLPVSPPPGAMAVNVGDMLQRLTHNRLPSTTHRVRNPDAGRASVARYSMPFRSEERRGGKECVSTCRARGAPDH